ncbi:MAG: phosphate/phosphite/phosphonate ABC transporter substrate-binding protein [Planctomycetota bacterium]
MPSSHPTRSAGSAVVTVLVCVALIVAAVAVYLAASGGNNTLGVQAEREQLLLGLGAGVSNQLDARFDDADGDLVADPPETTRNPDKLTLSYLSSAANVSLKHLATLAADLSETTGKTVTARMYPDADAALAALASGELHVTGFNTGNVPRAVNVAGFVPVAAPSHAEQPAEYRMVIAVAADSPIQSLEDLAGHTVAFTRPGSNSGYKAPLILLRDQAGLVPPTDYRWTFTYGHARSIAGLAGGTYDVIATASDLLQAAVDAGEIESSAFRVVYESEAFPAAAIGHAHDLDPALAEKIAAALLAFEPTQNAAEAFVNADAMSPVNFKDDFALIRRIDDDAGFAHTLPSRDAEPVVETVDEAL